MQSFTFGTIAPTDQHIHQWLKDRQELIVVLDELCRYRPFQHTQQSSVLEALQAFCQLLVDYVSMGHFEIFEYLLHSMEPSQGPYRQGQQLLPFLLQNTLAAVEFNDRYQGNQTLDSLENDLSFLVERIADRFEWEDQMLHAYLSCETLSCETLSGEAF